jgi:hypothetical protein
LQVSVVSQITEQMVCQVSQFQTSSQLHSASKCSLALAVVSLNVNYSTL